MQQQRISRRQPLAKRVYKAPSPIHGNGCFARIAFAAGDYIGTYEGPAADRDGTYVLWVCPQGEDPASRDGRNLLRYLNHRDDANAEFDGFDLYARHAISVGEEITFDYSGAEQLAGETPGRAGAEPGRAGDRQIAGTPGARGTSDGRRP